MNITKADFVIALFLAFAIGFGLAWKIFTGQ